MMVNVAAKRTDLMNGCCEVCSCTRWAYIAQTCLNMVCAGQMHLLA